MGKQDSESDDRFDQWNSLIEENLYPDDPDETEEEPSDYDEGE